MTPYPPAPWQTRGQAWFRPYLVDASTVTPPAGLEVRSRGGRCVGLLGYVSYEAPSLLVYQELLWMPCRVRARTAAGRGAVGWHVAKMLVDHPDSVAAGRAMWALPKQLARFDRTEGEINMTGEDGARVRWVSRCAPGPRRGFRVASAIVTLQMRGPELVRFKGDFRGTLSAARAHVVVEGLDGTWRSLLTATPLGPLGAELRAFRAEMHAPY